GSDDRRNDIACERLGVQRATKAIRALIDQPSTEGGKEAGRMAGAAARRFQLGDRVTKTKGSSWTGRVVGFYSTTLTPVGYGIESENEPGSVQHYPEAARAFAEIRAGFDPAFGAEAGR